MDTIRSMLPPGSFEEIPSTDLIFAVEHGSPGNDKNDDLPIKMVIVHNYVELPEVHVQEG